MTTLPDSLTGTRHSLHRLAEHLLSPARHAATGRIGLTPHPDGIRTQTFGDDGRFIAVELDEVVLIVGGVERAGIRPATLREAREALGVTALAPREVYTPTTTDDPDLPLTLDRAAMRVLADWYALGAAALDDVSRRLAELAPSKAQLWPEHLDVAVTVGDVNVGFSPGDDAIGVPYCYVQPHVPPPGGDPFWNAPFGAYRTIHDIHGVDEGVAFLLDGHRRHHDARQEQTT